MRDYIQKDYFCIDFIMGILEKRTRSIYEIIRQTIAYTQTLENKAKTQTT